MSPIEALWHCPVCGGSRAEPRFRRTTPAAPGQLDADSFTPSSVRFGTTVAPLNRCVACTHVSLATTLPSEVFEGAYSDVSDVVSLDEEQGQVATSGRDLERLERWVQPGRLLDVGCWTGSLLVAATRRGWKAEGLEPSAWACAQARDRGCEVRQAVLEDVDLPEAAFEAVVAADVIEHLFDPVSAVRTLNDALTPGGALFVTVPDAGSVVARLLGPRWWSVMPMHVQYFSQTSMRRLLEDQGLEVVSIATHPKSFSARYYVDRLAAFQPVAGRLASAVLRRSGRANKLVAPDLRDRMAVIARKPDTS